MNHVMIHEEYLDFTKKNYTQLYMWLKQLTHPIRNGAFDLLKRNSRVFRTTPKPLIF